jgi:hypothetical protein
VDRRAKTIQTFAIVKTTENADTVESAENPHPHFFS